MVKVNAGVEVVAGLQDAQAVPERSKPVSCSFLHGLKQSVWGVGKLVNPHAAL